jgi:hypothetical protein
LVNVSLVVSCVRNQELFDTRHKLLVIVQSYVVDAGDESRVLNRVLL